MYEKCKASRSYLNRNSTIGYQPSIHTFGLRVDYLATERNKNGVVSFTTHLKQNPLDTQNQQFELDPVLEARGEEFTNPETNQLMYCLDLADFELAERPFKAYIKLRSTMMELYGPGGKFFMKGKLHRTVEMCILKSSHLEVEYLGCKEGTRLMILEDL